MMITLGLGANSISFADYEQSGWVFTDLTDWFGQTDDKVPVQERPQAHGAFSVSKSLRSARAVSFDAFFSGSSSAEVEAAYDALASVGSEGPVPMRVVSDSGDTTRMVSVQASSAVDNRGMRFGVVSVDCVARDPRRYSSSQSVSETGPATQGQGRTWPAVWPLVWPGGGSPGRITLTNTGTAPSAPMFTLVGGFDSALITCVETGSRIGLDRHVPNGSQVVIDTVQRRAIIDGQSDVSRWLQFREWEVIPASSSRSFQFDVVNPVGLPVLRGVVSSAWW